MLSQYVTMNMIRLGNIVLVDGNSDGVVDLNHEQDYAFDAKTRFPLTNSQVLKRLQTNQEQTLSLRFVMPKEFISFQTQGVVLGYLHTPPTRTMTPRSLSAGNGVLGVLILVGGALALDHYIQPGLSPEDVEVEDVPEFYIYAMDGATTTLSPVEGDPSVPTLEFPAEDEDVDDTWSDRNDAEVASEDEANAREFKSKDPSQAAAYFRSAARANENLGNRDKAIELMHEAVEIETGTAQLARDHAELSRLYDLDDQRALELYHVEQAMRLFRSIWRNNESGPRALQLAQEFLKEDPRRALAYLREAITDFLKANTMSQWKQVFDTLEQILENDTSIEANEVYREIAEQIQQALGNMAFQDWLRTLPDSAVDFYDVAIEVY